MDTTFFIACKTKFITTLSVVSLLLFFLAFNQQSNAQSLTITSSGDSGPTSGTNWSIVGNELQVTGTATIRASVITNHLSTQPLFIKGANSNLSVTVSEAITSTSAQGDLSIGDSGNAGSVLANSAITVSKKLIINGGEVTVSSNLSTQNTSGEGIVINASKLIVNPVNVTSQGADIELLVNNSPFTSSNDNAVFFGGSLTNLVHINANGGDIRVEGSYGASGTAGGIDRGLSINHTKIETHAAGSIRLFADASSITNTSSTAWGIQASFLYIRTASGKIDIIGIGGKKIPNSRGIHFDDRPLKILSTSGAITIEDRKPDGLTGESIGLFLKPNSTENIFIGADGSDVVTSTSHVTLRSDILDFKIHSGRTIELRTSGHVVLEPETDSFDQEVSTAALHLPLTPSGLSIGKATNTGNVRIGSATNIAGPIDIFGGTIILDTDLTTTNGGDISLYTDNPLGGLNTPRTLTSAGAFKYIPRTTSFLADVTYPITNLSVTSTGLTLGKASNIADITIDANQTMMGPIDIFGGTITLNANLTTTNNGDISLYTDNPLGGLNTPRTLTSAGAFKYIPRGTTFAEHVTYPIANLTATSTGLTIGNATNAKNISINADITSSTGIELLGNNLTINANLQTTNSANLAFKGDASIAAGKFIASSGDFTHDGDLIFKSLLSDKNLK